MVSWKTLGFLSAGMLLLGLPSWGLVAGNGTCWGGPLPMNLVGLPLGTGTDNGVRVEVFLLQEAYPEQRPPDAPTHRFTMRVSDGSTGGLIPDASVTVSALRTGSPDGRRSTASFRRPFYYADMRLPELGDYTIVVECSSGGRAAKVSFPYRYLPAPAQHAPGKEPEPVVEGDSAPAGTGSR